MGVTVPLPPAPVPPEGGAPLTPFEPPAPVVPPAPCMSGLELSAGHVLSRRLGTGGHIGVAVARAVE